MNTRRVVRWLAAVALGVCATAGGADASGLNLGWGAYCPTSQSSMVNVNDPCDGSTGNVYTIIGSFRPSVPLSAVQSETFTVKIAELAPATSDYWHLEDENQPGQNNPAGCRGHNSETGNVGSLVVNVRDSAFPATFTACHKIWGEAPSGGIDWNPGVPIPFDTQLVGTFSAPAMQAVTAGLQYGAFVATIDTNHQVLDPSDPPSYVCAGCLDAVCFEFRDLIIRQPPGTPGGDVEITSEDTRRWVTWQGSTLCITPARRPTWGQLKSLYR